MVTLFTRLNERSLGNTWKENFNPLSSSDLPPHTCPATGCLHPLYQGYFATPADYMRWYERNGPVRDPAAPTVAVLLYRKHVITDQVREGEWIN